MLAQSFPVGDSPFSRILHVVQSLSSKTSASALAIGVSAGVLAWAVDSWHPDQILAWFGAIAGAITLTMLFVLQHTQTRQQAALQLKLDEILHALPSADDRLISLESAPAGERLAVERRLSALRAQLPT
ncbi:low affinity iron permease family protein [Pengzhenrongella phosphoraccumulans]|jgi:low affinity Fe/Cu permease|uniref:low affinity iron permease family protein n=1 Tax=Pengzhenrongella phosphoraccumulans TaxID=3114394 RepID=UPI00388DFF2E